MNCSVASCGVSYVILFTAANFAVCAANLSSHDSKPQKGVSGKLVLDAGSSLCSA